MTISSTIRKAGPYIGNDVTTVFPFSFKVFTSADLYVVRLDEDTGVETQLALSTNYSVSLNADQNANPGGTITLISALADGYTLTISSNISALQATDLTNQGGFYPAVITNALDKLTILIQQLLEAASRSLRLPISTSSSVSAELPAPEASKLIGWNADADGLENYNASTLATLVAYGTANADIFDGDGTTTVFVLSANPAVLNNLDVSISGVTQTPGIDYTWTSGTNITFTTAPPAGTDNVLVRYMQGLAAPDLPLRSDLALPAGASTVGAVATSPVSGATVQAQLTAIAALLQHRPCVNMVRSANSTNNTLTSAAWRVYDENGLAISTTGTTTEGLQEAINYAARYGYDLRVWGGGIKAAYFGQAYGGALGNNPFATTNLSRVVTVTHASHGRATGDKITFNNLSGAVNGIPASEFLNENVITVINANSYSFTTTTTAATSTGSGGGASCRWQDSGQDVAIISCSTGVVVPPLQGVNWEIHATINIGGSATTAGIAFDSIMASEIKITDQIVCVASYPIGVEFKPTNELPQDPNGPVVTSSRIYVPSVVMLSPTGTCVSLDCTNGDVADAVFDIIEPNGGAFGVRTVFAATHGVRGNKIRINGAHDQTSAMVSAGLSATGAANSYGNQWEIQGHPATGAVGVDIWGVNDHFVIDVNTALGTPAVGIKYESSASGNVVVGHRVEGTLVLQDLSTDKSNTFIGSRIAASVHRNNVDQTAVATTTWTKIQFTSEAFDAGGKFDNATNYRWTPGRVGMALITANVAWTTAVDATLAGIAIYKNGSANREEYTYMSSAGGSQGPSITAQVLVDSQTDYFEIFVRQDSGSNRDINGAVVDTFATFLMLP